MSRRPRSTRVWAESAVVSHWLAGESLDSITVRSHSRRGTEHPLFWLTTPAGVKARAENEDLVRRWLRRKLRPLGLVA